MLYVGYIITYPGIMARPVSGIPSSAFSPAHKSVGMHLNIRKLGNSYPTRRSEFGNAPDKGNTTYAEIT